MCRLRAFTKTLNTFYKSRNTSRDHDRKYSPKDPSVYLSARTDGKPLRLLYSTFIWEVCDKKPGSPYFELELYVLPRERTRNFHITPSWEHSCSLGPSDQPCPLPEIGVACHLVKDASSGECLAQLGSWIANCRENHTACPDNSETALPKRVIDVGPADGSEMPRLYISQGETRSYVALSHCWGRSKLVTTTRATVAARGLGIPWGELSRTFQDAITLTRRLGIRYLWIDSLCIVQDDKVDWAEQASKMAGIYSAAYLIIAATDSTDGSGGLFKPRRRVEVAPGIFARQRLNREMFESDNSICPRYPLLTRAWCFQERMLSARVIHYTSAGMLFECLTCIRHEGDDASVSSPKAEYAEDLQRTEDGHVDDEPRAKQSPSGGEEELPDDGPNQVWLNMRYERWGFIVESFSAGNLTYRTDTFPALSAIAGQLYVPQMGRYVAGLWEGDMAFGLLWVGADDPTKRPGVYRRPAQYVAPTFSWVSRTGPVVMFNINTDNFKVQFSVLGASCLLRGSDPYGQISSGFVRVRGRMVQAKYHQPGCSDSECEGLWTPTQRPGVPRNVRELDSLVHDECHVFVKGFRPVDISADSEEDAKMPDGEAVYCFEILRMGAIDEEDGRDEDDTGWNSVVLILRRSLTGENCYTRAAASFVFDPRMLKDAPEVDITIL